MATKPTSKQNLKLGKGKLKLWYLIPAVVLVAVIGVIVVRMSGASGRVWTPKDAQFKYGGSAVLKEKSNGTKYVVASSASATDPAATSWVSLVLDVPIGREVNAHSLCTNVDVTTAEATIESVGGTTASDANGNTTSSRFDAAGEANRKTTVYKKGFNRICVPIKPQKAVTATTIVFALGVKTGSINVNSFREMNNSTSDQVWDSYLFLDGASVNAGKLIPETEFVNVPANSTNKVWDAKKNRSAYVNVAAFSDSPWPGTKYCADIKGVAVSSQVKMDGSVGGLTQAMGGVMTAQTVRVTKDATAVVCTTTAAQAANMDYVLSPRVTVVTGEVQVSRIYKKQ